MDVWARALMFGLMLLATGLMVMVFAFIVRLLFSEVNRWFKEKPRGS